MKKILMGTSAVALAGVSATSANADAEWNVAWGGNMSTIFNFVNTDAGEPGDFDGFDVLQNGEIHFKPSVKLSENLQFGVRVELEADSFDSADRIDEAYITVGNPDGGGWGQFIIGSTDSPFGKMGVGAPGVGFAGVNSGTMTGTLLGGGFGARGNTSQLAGDAMRVNYYSPSFAGFKVGVGYARANDEDDRSFNDRDSGRHDIFSIGAGYSGSFGNVSVDVSATYETASDEGSAAIPGIPGTPAIPGVVGQNASGPLRGVAIGPQGTVYRPLNTAAAQAAAPNLQIITPSQPAQMRIEPRSFVPAVAATPAIAAGRDSDPRRFSFGAKVGFGDISVGGAYAHLDDDITGLDETNFFSAGISYSADPWGVSLSGAHTDADGYDTNQIALNGEYKLGTGVTAAAYIGWAERDNDGAGESYDGFAVGTGLKLSF